MIIKKGAALTRLEQLRFLHEKCKRAFHQHPTPSLGKSLREIEASIRYEERVARKGASK